MYFYDKAEQKRLCALESILRSNPRALVHIHTANATAFIASYKLTALSVLHAERVIVHQTTFVHLFFDTALSGWDLDYVVLRDLETLSPNFMALQEANSVSEVRKFKGHHINNGFLRFQQGHPFLRAAMDSFVAVWKSQPLRPGSFLADLLAAGCPIAYTALLSPDAKPVTGGVAWGSVP
ncbi:hypothetical protein GPECTOR_22g886 [Gonium pectorale]|uniref:Uncharacterized protein n=1 Tax=Gonium pectorale TaxID=33097 RepID=A0A150GHG5_GONPE|nr:hypothetical protein GPECTOR_22g886 [Gonium pectorale]|eukprot:KXZ49292.1 hypothetical protein GPECTOR_22g886 [Gonium pectorale]